MHLFQPNFYPPYCYWVCSPSPSQFYPYGLELAPSALQPQQIPNFVSQEPTTTEKTASSESKELLFDSKRKQNQSPYRNTLTNLGNQIISFTSNEHRSKQALTRVFANITALEIEAYYRYVVKIRKYASGYINLKKLHQVWSCKLSENQNQHRIFLKMCRYYLENLCIPALITSRKLKKNVLNHHLITRRKLIRMIQNQQNQY